MDSKVPLSEKLANALPLPTGVSLKVYHVSTPPTRSSRAIFAAAPGTEEQRTFCESHFLAITVPSKSDHGMLALAAEVLIFTTADFTLIFVSKVDTTGYLYINNVPKGKDVSKIILSTFLQHLLDARSHGSKVVLSLFARAEEQYLFPGSGKNGAKRVVGDRTLIKWWCRVLDPVLRESEFSKTSTTLAHKCPTAHVLVAGSDANERRNVLPTSARQDLPDHVRWLWSYPTNLIAPDPSAPTQCLIPRLPDDPKTRYLEELDEEVEKHGHWTSIETIAQFWEVMDTRKECAAGRAVGYIWMIFYPAKVAHSGAGSLDKPMQSQPGEDIQKGTWEISAPNHSQPAADDAATNELPATSALLGRPPLALQTVSPSPSSPPRTCHTLNSNHQAEIALPEPEEQFHDVAERVTAPWPQTSRGNLVLTEEQYQILMDELLQLDFDNQELSEKSTKTWVSKAASFCPSPSQDWGVEVMGRERSGSSGTKRRVEEIEPLPQPGPDVKPAINLLSAGLVRKKPKVK